MVNMQITRWHPDTCDCVIEYEWDRDLPPESRTHNLYNVVSKCSEHSGLNDNDVWTHGLEQNQRKNYALDEAAERLGLPEDGNRFKDLMELYVESWNYTGTGASRVLHIVTKGLTGSQRNQVQSRIDTVFGSGKVVIE